jgi:hypothetical protein
VARLPYDLGMLGVKAVLGQRLGLRSWNRNSTRTGSFVLGVSDLDITVVYGDHLYFPSLISHLRKLKKLIIFLGEANLYKFDHLSMILPRMNTYELKRDPRLETFATHEKTFDDVEKFVFTQRMLFSDAHTLFANPEYRQAKWKYHYKLIGITPPEKIEVKDVVELLKKLAVNSERICHSLDLWASQFSQDGYDVFRANLGEGFRIMAPQCYVWFQKHEDRPFLQTLSDWEKQLLKRQIDWEVWGLYTQKYLPQQDTVKEHLKRLGFAYRYAAGLPEAMRLEKEISLVFSV